MFGTRPILWEPLAYMLEAFSKCQQICLNVFVLSKNVLPKIAFFIFLVVMLFVRLHHFTSYLILTYKINFPLIKTLLLRLNKLPMSRKSFFDKRAL